MPSPRKRNSLGQFQDSWYLDDRSSGGCPTDRHQMPTGLPPWKFRPYVKGPTRRYIEGDRGYLGGRRVRVYAKTPQEAKAKAAAKERRIKTLAATAIALNGPQLFAAAESIDIATRLGVKAVEIVREYEKKHPLGGASRTIEQVREELIAIKRKGERRDVYVRGLDYRIRRLIDAVGNIPVSSITTEMLTKELNSHLWKAGTVHGVVTSWRVFFNYCEEEGYALANPCDKLRLPRRRWAKPELLPAALVHRLLAGCITHAHMARCLAYVAIGCFTGIRPAEMERLRWEMIDLDAGYITIDGEDAKCGERGIVKMHANLIGWIRPIAKMSGPVLEAPVSTLRSLCRTFLAGFLKNNVWPHDCMRHGYASFHYGYFRDIGEVCANLRHGTGQLVFINHYYIVRPPAEAVYFWTMIVRPVALLLP